MEVKTKFNLGDEVWMMESNKAVSGSIKELTINIRFNGKNTIKYAIKVLWKSHIWDTTRYEEELFPTKEELLKSL